MFLQLCFVVFVASVAAFPQPESEDQETTTPYSYKPPLFGGCRFGDRPELSHGRHDLLRPPFVEPGQDFDAMVLIIECDPGYDVNGPFWYKKVVCIHGNWSKSYKVNCIRSCVTPLDPSVEYRCIVPPPPSRCFKFSNGLLYKVSCPIPEGADKGYRICKEYEKNGTMVQPVCKSGYKAIELPKMQCIGSTWDVTPSCLPNVTMADSATNPRSSDLSPKADRDVENVQE